MQTLVRGFQILDYLVGASTVAYGLYTRSPLVVVLGAGGLVLARLNVAERLSANLKGYFLRKKAPHAVGPLSPELEPIEPSTQAASASVGPANYAQHKLAIGALRVGSSSHSLLRSDVALNHAVPRLGPFTK